MRRIVLAPSFVGEKNLCGLVCTLCLRRGGVVVNAFS
jgi:hypothetical protein